MPPLTSPLTLRAPAGLLWQCCVRASTWIASTLLASGVPTRRLTATSMSRPSLSCPAWPPMLRGGAFRLPPQSSLPSCTLRRPCGTGCPTLRLAFGQQQWPACFRPPAHWAGEPANTTHSALGTSLEKASLSPHSYTHTSYIACTPSRRGVGAPPVGSGMFPRETGAQTKRRQADKHTEHDDVQNQIQPTVH